jgi:serine/threonine protein kinase
MSWLDDRAVTRLQAAATWPELDSDRYTVLTEIGRGGMGTVYLARDEALGREVAIKVSNAIASAELERRIRTEARVLARLEHPGIVPIHDVGRLVDGRLFYVMKRVRGETLLAHLATRPGLGERLGIFERICDPVAFAHAQGCIHRDLKPENVMVGSFGEVMVMDWGVAKTEDATEETGTAAPVPDRDTLAGTILGTPGYMSPEQAAGAAGRVDVRTDVYGLGAILFTLLTGEPPADPTAAAARIRQAVAVPRLLQAICIRALAPRASERYADVAALAADIARFRAGQAVVAHPETIVERTARFARTYRTPILLVLAYMLMRAIVAVVAGR